MKKLRYKRMCIRCLEFYRTDAKFSKICFKCRKKRGGDKYYYSRTGLRGKVERLKKLNDDAMEEI